MVLVDTSVWIDHFRCGTPSFVRLLSEGSVLMHPFVIGELACGNLKNRKATLTYLTELQQAIAATPEEVFEMIEHRRLWGRGIGWMDIHLLASAVLANAKLWTLDQRLAETARAINVKVFEPAPRPS